MSEVRRAMKLADPDALLLRQERERRRDQRHFERTMLAAALAVAVLAAVAGWWLYLTGAGCGVTQ